MSQSNPYYIDLRKARSLLVQGIDEKEIEKICAVVRGLIFAMVEGAKSGHPGGSSSKVEQLVTLLCSGNLAFDANDPKNPGRDRIVWSAGHCSPLLHALNALIRGLSPGVEEKYFPSIEDLAKFRTRGGPSGHVESHYALADASTGSSGHGLSAGLGFAVLHQSCGLPMKTYVIMGDAETEEGMTFEARNVAATIGTLNLIVLLDHNGFGIDGSITEAMTVPISDQWKMMGWNVIEVDGHDVRQLAEAYEISNRFNGSPTVIISHTVKGKFYGKLENTCTSHGTPIGSSEYLEVMNGLGFSDGIGKSTVEDLLAVFHSLGHTSIRYFTERLNQSTWNIWPEKKYADLMIDALEDRALADFKMFGRPTLLPHELHFKEGVPVPTRKATEACFEWEMNRNAFFYVTTGDLSGSILTAKAEQTYGIINRKNPYGRGIRSGIAEQNMAMMSVTMASDVLPGGFKPMNVFASYGVFTNMMANSVRMGLINNAMNPEDKAFFILLAAHDGPETGEDGPTHHGLFWMSLYMAYPGIKVYKPLDANEAVEMYFHARAKGDPVAFSVARPNTPVFKRGEGGQTLASASEAVNGAYVFKEYDEENAEPKLAIAVAGGQTMQNLLDVLPEIETKANVKIIAVTSPELFEDLCENDPRKADAIFSDEDRKNVIALHNGWTGFLHAFLLPKDHKKINLGISKFNHSGRPNEVYEEAGLDPKSIAKKILAALKK